MVAPRRSTLTVTPRRARTRATAVLAVLTVLAAVPTALQPLGGPARAAAAAPDGGSEAPSDSRSQLVAALAKAEDTGERVEVVGWRTETTTTYAQPSGLAVTEHSPVPIRIRRGGDWVPVDPALEARDGAWRPKATPGDVAVSRGGATAPLARVAAGNRSVAVSWPASLPEPTVDGSTARYALDPGTVLRTRATVQGVNVHIVLTEKPQTAPVWRLPLQLSGLSIAERPDGSFVLTDNAGEAVLNIAAPVMWDATTTAEGLPANVVPVDARLVTEKGRQSLELAPDPAFLASATLPIVVDPDLVTASALRDTYVYETGMTASNGSHYTLAAGWTSDRARHRGYVQWQTPDLQNRHIVSASLQVYNWHSGTCTPTPLGIWPVAEPWGMGMLWNDQPAVNYSTPYETSKSFAHGNEQLGCGNAYEQIDLTSMVRAWVYGDLPNYGILLRATPSETDPNGYKLLCSFNEDPDHSSCYSASRRPTLSVTWDPGVVRLAAPTVVHSNGAELRWSRYAGTAFDRYEVHRSTVAGFTPSASTLLTTIGVDEVTRYVDSTAKPSTAFRYKVVSSGATSNEITVTTPVAGDATVTLQPLPARGKATYLHTTPGQTGCVNAASNFGASPDLRTGVSVDGSVSRPMLGFDLRDIPVDATVKSANLKLSWQRSDSRQSRQINLHRVTRAWSEGSGDADCNGTGASWQEAVGGQAWTTQGGDYDPAVIASVGAKSRTTAGTDTYTVTSLVKQWVNGDAPNHGMLLKYSSETKPSSGMWWFDYLADDDRTDQSLRPRLDVTYTDGSVSRGPRVTVSTPGTNTTVSGSAVKLAATAADDRRVDKVEFLVDGVVKATDTAAPYETTWNSATVTNGAHTITARATDDVGNTTTSSPVSVTVDNTNPPTGSLTAPAAGSNLSGTVALSASASDDVGVKQVEFLVDGDRVGAPDTTSPYTINWDTKHPLTGAFDGTHDITAAITDTSGQTITTAARTITVENSKDTKYKATFELNPTTTGGDVFPPIMTENSTATANDPYAGTQNADGTWGGSWNKNFLVKPCYYNGNCDGKIAPTVCATGDYCPTVKVTNTSGQAWNGADKIELWYAWYAPNGALLFEGPATAKFPTNVADKDAHTLPLIIEPPALPPGADLGEYRLRIDLYDTVNNVWFAQRGNPPIDNPIVVAKKLDDRLGLERFWDYESEPLGAGMSTLTNVANGNMLWNWSPFAAPGRGLSTVLNLTYNSLEDHSKSPAGNNVSLAISGLVPFGEQLDIHPNKADEISGHAKKWVRFADGDGTVHQFDYDSATGQWKEPPGVNLYLRALSDTDPKGKWALTRPDAVTFYFDTDGYPTRVEDRNGNKITFKVDPTPPGEDPGGPKKRITEVTDPSGTRHFDIDYYSKDEAKRAHVRGNIQRITDYSGSALDFDYYDDGNLLRLTQRGGTKANGDYLPDRTFVFTYTTPAGDGPAITTEAARVNPDPKTAAQSTRIFSVRDPKGTETRYDYYGPGEGPQLRWKLQSRTNRTNHTTTFAYNLADRVTTVAAPENRTTKYSYEPDGRVTKINDPAGRDTLISWTSDFNVSQVTEPSGKTLKFTWNTNGRLTSRTNQLDQTTSLVYLDKAVDGADTGKHLSLLDTVTTPKGGKWDFDYDPYDNIDFVTDPVGAKTDYDVNGPGSTDPGTIASIRDPNTVKAGGTTKTVFNSYDVSGQPIQVTDPEGGISRYS